MSDRFEVSVVAGVCKVLLELLYNDAQVVRKPPSSKPNTKRVSELGGVLVLGVEKLSYAHRCRWSRCDFKYEETLFHIASSVRQHGECSKSWNRSRTRRCCASR
jgi:hypothetical protein